MSPFAIIVLVVVFVFLVVPSFLRANEVCAISVRDGRTIVYRGRAPTALLTEIDDVVAKPPVRAAIISIVKEGGSPRLVVSGVDDRTAQRLRNVLGAYPYRLFLTAKARPGRNLGQRLGIAWLAWKLDDRR